MRNEKIIEAVKITLTDHTYENILKTDDHEIWRCKVPGSWCKAFDIIIGRSYITMNGDYSPLSFKVGKDYGISFLAGNDVEYYIKSKLDYSFQNDIELCLSSFHHVIKEIIFDNFFSDIDDDELNDFEEFADLSFEKIIYHLNNTENFSNGSSYFSDLLMHVTDITNLEDAYIYLQNFYSISDPGEYGDITRTSQSLIYRLYFLNHAAKEIMKIRND